MKQTQKLVDKNHGCILDVKEKDVKTGHTPMQCRNHTNKSAGENRNFIKWSFNEEICET